MSNVIPDRQAIPLTDMIPETLLGDGSIRDLLQNHHATVNYRLPLIRNHSTLLGSRQPHNQQDPTALIPNGRVGLRLSW